MVAADAPRTARAYVPGGKLEAPAELRITRASAPLRHDFKTAFVSFPNEDSQSQTEGGSAQPGGEAALRCAVLFRRQEGGSY